MPVPDYTPDDTAPVAIALPGYAGTGTAPVAGAVADFAPADAPAVAAGLADFSGTAAAPVLKAPGTFTPAGAPPVAAATGDFTGTAAAPGVKNPGDYDGNNAPAAAANPGGFRGTGDAPDEVPVITTPQPAPTDATMQTPTLTLIGRAAVDQIFGYFAAPAALSVKGAQIFAQTAPTGADLIVEFVKDDGTSHGVSITLPAGEDRAKVTFGAAVALLTDGVVRAKVTQAGSGEAGGYLTVQLITQLNS